MAGALVLRILVRSSSSLERQWRGVIDPHLLAHLKVGAGGRRVHPLDTVVSTLILASIGLAGPTWEREETPFSEDTAPLVLTLQLSQSMDAIDVSPTRLERAKQKIRDLLERRKGPRTALLAYAGTAHVVLPLTDDPSVLETFVTELATNLMPVPGNDPVRALRLAETMLEKEETPGTILFLTDGIPAEAADTFVARGDRSRDAVMALAFGTSEGGPVRLPDERFATDASGRRIVARLDREGLETLADRAGVWVASATVSPADIDSIDRPHGAPPPLRPGGRPGGPLVRRGLLAGVAGGPPGPLLVPQGLDGALGHGGPRRVPAERGGSRVRRSGGVSVLRPLAHPGPAGPLLAGARRAPEGRRALRGPDLEGSGLLPGRELGGRHSPVRPRGDTAEGWFNLGNAYAQSGDHEEAVRAYDEALACQPGWTEAEENRALVASLIPPPEPESDEGAAGRPPQRAGRDPVRREGEEGTGGRDPAGDAHRRAEGRDVAPPSPGDPRRLPPPQVRRPGRGGGRVTAWGRGPLAASVLSLVLLCPAASAQEAGEAPIVRTRLETSTPVMVGETVTVSVDVLTPSWFPRAPQFPAALQVDNAVAVFDETFRTNLGERIEGESWSGIRRHYLIYPQLAGTYTVPPIEVEVVYALSNARPSDPLTLRGPELRFEARVPSEAGGLDYFIAARGFSLEQQVEPDPEGLRVGDAVTRTVTLRATDASSMMLPITEFPEIDGLAVYPDPTRVLDAGGERGETREATRIDAATYVLETEGSYTLPAIERSWWDVSAGRLRTASVPPVSLDVAPNPGLSGEIALPPELQLVEPAPTAAPSREWLVRLFGGLAAVGLVGWIALRRGPRVARRLAEVQRRRQESEGAHLRRLRAACRADDAARAMRALLAWVDRTTAPGGSSRSRPGCGRRATASWLRRWLSSRRPSTGATTRRAGAVSGWPAPCTGPIERSAAPTCAVSGSPR